jgi:hypothetical protein
MSNETPVVFDQEAYAAQLERHELTLTKLLRKFHPQHDAEIFDALVCGSVHLRKTADEIRRRHRELTDMEAQTVERRLARLGLPRDV